MQQETQVIMDSWTGLEIGTSRSITWLQELSDISLELQLMRLNGLTELHSHINCITWCFKMKWVLLIIILIMLCSPVSAINWLTRLNPWTRERDFFRRV